MKRASFFVPVSDEILSDTYSVVDELALLLLPEPEQTVERLRRGQAALWHSRRERWNTADLVERELPWWDHEPEEWRPGWQIYEEDLGGWSW